MDDKQKTFNYIKHGFTQEDVLVRLTPLSKKSITQMINSTMFRSTSPDTGSWRSGRPTGGEWDTMRARHFLGRHY